MLIKDLMTKDAITCSPNNKISDVLSKMQKHKIHQLPVLDGKELRGILTLNKIVTKNIDITTTNISTLMIPVTKINPNYDVNDAIELIINSNLRAIPVYDSELRGMISETDLIKAIKLDGTASNVMRDCVSVNKNDTIGKVKNLMINKNVSRIPVLDDGKVVGMIGTLDLIKTMTKKKFEARDKVSSYKEIHRMRLDETTAETIMQKPSVITVDSNLNEIITLLQKNDALVVEDCKGIITPKDILRMIVRPKKFEYIQITGLKDESQSEIDKIYQAAGELIKSLSALELQPMKIFIDYCSLRGRKKYSIHVQLPTNVGTFISTKAQGMDLVSVSQEAMNNLKREIMKKYEKVKKHSKHRGKERIT